MKNNNARDMLREMEDCRAMVNERLSAVVTAGSESFAELLESIRYSLLDGGKRIRPVICVKFCEAAGGLPEAALGAACAIEMIHAYSLIHDDLPCMDDSDMRRGKPSNHIKFDEFTATLAGDALQAAAFGTLLGSDLPPGALVEMAKILSDAAGPYGICGGQYLDLKGESKLLTEEMLTEIHNMKTAALISAAARIGVIAAGGTPGQLAAAGEYALAVGYAFQVRDDVLDIIAEESELGKPTGSDLSNNKVTFASLMGIKKCEETITKETERAIAALEGNFSETCFLSWLACMLADRKS